MAASPSLRAVALRLLAQREHSVVEMRRKLLKRLERADALDQAAAAAALAAEGGAGPDAAPAAGTAATPAERVEQVIAWLLEHRHLSEERFAESRVHARSARFGNLRIRGELAQHGVQLAPEAAAELAASEAQRAQGVWQRKYGRAPADAREHARQVRFLISRGFSPTVIAGLMRRCGQAGDEGS